MVRMYPPQSFRGYVGTNTNFPGQGGEGGGITPLLLEGTGDGGTIEYNLGGTTGPIEVVVE